MNKECKGLPKTDLLRLLDESISGNIVYTEDVLHMLEVYGDTYVQEEGSILWKIKSEEKRTDLTLDEALESAEAGNFVTSEYFSSDQSMHYWNGRFYYEDGAVVTPEFLHSENWASKNPWRVTIPKDIVDTDKLQEMHIQSGGYMLDNHTYNECVLQTRRK